MTAEESKALEGLWMSAAEVRNVLKAAEPWILPDYLETAMKIFEGLEVYRGTLSREGEWQKVLLTDPDMDQTERVMFPDETYRCSVCGSKAYFGATCTRDNYCQRCGSKMRNAGRRTK